MRLALPLALATSCWVAGCHDDACVWSSQRDTETVAVGLRRAATPIDSTVAFSAVATSRSLATDERATRVTLSLDVTNDVVIDRLNLEVELGDPELASALVQLAPIASFRALRDSTIVAEGAATGELALELLAADCELSDVARDTGRSWQCATDADLTVDATIVIADETYELAASLAQRETLLEMCQPCNGVEGCDY